MRKVIGFIRFKVYQVIKFGAAEPRGISARGEFGWNINDSYAYCDTPATC